MGNFVVERHGFTSASELVKSAVTDMIANGFTLVWNGVPGPTNENSNPWNPASITSPFRVILEADETVDPLNDSALPEGSRQPWRVCFDVQASELAFVYVATPLQLTDEGGVATERVIGLFNGNAQVQHLDVLGAIGERMGNPSSSGNQPGRINEFGIYSAPTGTGLAGGSDETNKGLVNRVRRIEGNGANEPLSYRLTISPRGFWLGVWTAAISAESSSGFNWVLVQRPVDRNTGVVLTTGKAPVFCVNAVGDNIWQFTVRESDVIRPGKRRSATMNEEDSEAIINAQNQVSLSEDGKYIVTFPSRLNTSRYRYPHELDMIGITSADVVSQFSDVPLTVYGEAEPRDYKAMHSNSGSNTGMRVLVLKDGGGITNPTGA